MLSHCRRAATLTMTSAIWFCVVHVFTSGLPCSQGVEVMCSFDRANAAVAARATPKARPSQAELDFWFGDAR